MFKWLKSNERGSGILDALVGAFLIGVASYTLYTIQENNTQAKTKVKRQWHIGLVARSIGNSIAGLSGDDFISHYNSSTRLPDRTIDDSIDPWLRTWINLHQEILDIRYKIECLDHSDGLADNLDACFENVLEFRKYNKNISVTIFYKLSDGAISQQLVHATWMPKAGL